MKSDIDIIKDCLEGNQLACKKLYEKYVPYCYGICIRYAVSQSDLKDVVQVIFSQVFQSLKNYDSGKAQFKTWFTRVCVNHILSYKKKLIRSLQTQNFENSYEIDRVYSGNNVR